ADPALLECEARLLARADLVFTGGYSLYEAKRDIDCRGECVDVAVPFALGLVQTVTTGKDEISHSKQPRFALQQGRVRKAERGQFVHAVIDDRRSVEMLGERHHHRRVEPEQRLRANARRDEHVEQLAQPCLDLVWVPPVRQARTKRDDAVRRERMMFKIRQRVIARDVLFPEEHRLVLREPLHQMLRPLGHEIPAKMRKADQRRVGLDCVRKAVILSATVHALLLREPAVIRLVNRTYAVSNNLAMQLSLL
ncbi:MAG: hypothetical protein EOP89_06985, partial [Lysobacteraceae bacterium]